MLSSIRAALGWAFWAFVAQLAGSALGMLGAVGPKSSGDGGCRLWCVIRTF